MVQVPCSSSRDCGGNAPQSPGHRLCWLEEGGQETQEKEFLVPFTKRETSLKLTSINSLWAIYCKDASSNAGNVHFRSTEKD